jgi:hypothetical protein
MKESLGLLIGILMLAGCATTSPEEKRAQEERRSHVTIISSLSASDAEQYKEVGPVKCDVYWHNLGQDCEESCRNDLKDQAAALNAPIVVVDTRQNKKCKLGLQDDACVEMHGHAYIRR